MLLRPNAPNPWRVLLAALGAAGPLILRDNFVAYLILAIFSVIDGALMRSFTYTGRDLLNNAFPLSAWLEVLAFYFTLAAALRLRDPGYKMTLTKAFGITTTFLMSLLATALGIMCLIVPGIWIGTKLSLAPFIHALAPQTAPLRATDAVVESWALTTGFFWPTVYFEFAQIVVAVLPGVLLLLGALAFFVRAHVTAYYSAPALLFVEIYFLQVSNLALLEWTSELRAHKRVPVPASPNADCD